ncbi:hypothetical protein LCGC14_1997280 [marine sediment metagenome]|uniref:Uncharacterized protein n=1 Tax=marine sediment metagenome TaxID=412755 RepID=A0A0F9F423_9ZZZZ
MGVLNNLQKGFNNTIKLAGRPITIRHLVGVTGSVWDDEVAWVVSGADVSTSGVIMNLQGQDSLLVEQGKLMNDDKRLYISGGINLTGSDWQAKIIIGDEAYSLASPGVTAPEVQGTRVYKRAFIRRLPTGSLIGE